MLSYHQFNHPKHKHTRGLLAADKGKQADLVAAEVAALFFFLLLLLIHILKHFVMSTPVLPVVGGHCLGVQSRFLSAACKGPLSKNPGDLLPHEQIAEMYKLFAVCLLGER